MTTVNMDSDEKKYAPYFKAVYKGYWPAVNEFLKFHPEGVRARTSLGQGGTALHVAASLGHLHIVEELVKLMSEEDVALVDYAGYTALAVAATTGITEIAQCIIKKNKNLIFLTDLPDVFVFDDMPVTMAVENGHLEMARYLYSVTPFEKLLPERGSHGAELLNRSFVSNFFDLALDLLRRCPSLATKQNRRHQNLVWALAGEPSMFSSGCRLLFWQQWIYQWIRIKSLSETETEDIRINITKLNTIEKENNLSKMAGLPQHQLAVYIFNMIGIKRIYEYKLIHELSRQLLHLTCNEIAALNIFSEMSNAFVYKSIFRAAESGIPEFITGVINAKPALLTSTDTDGRNLFFYAVKFRQAKVFSLIYGLVSKGAVVNTVDVYGNNLLHMAAELEPPTLGSSIPCAAIQMQIELQWFKEVEGIVPPTLREIRNNDGTTAKELFIQSHMTLLKEAEKWMKETATSCTVVTTLIVTIMFAASFTVPGGNNQNTGYPMFQDQKLFKLFIFSDAIALFFSTTSVLMFLGILTSRYSMFDFLKSSPAMLIIGLSMLFVSIIAMMISFYAAISLMLHGSQWITIPVILFAIVPISLFVWLQSGLFYDTYNVTLGRGIFERNMKPWL